MANVNNINRRTSFVPCVKHCRNAFGLIRYRKVNNLNYKSTEQTTRNQAVMDNREYWREPIVRNHTVSTP